MKGATAKKSRVTRQSEVKKAAKNIKKAKAKVLAAPALEKRNFNELVLEHRENGRKLARSILRRWRVRMPAEEIDSLVDLTLCEAGARFSPHKGASFMTFFFYHLRGHLVRAVASAAQTSQLFLNSSQHTGIETGDFHVTSEESSWAVMFESIYQGQNDTQNPEHLLMRKEDTEFCNKACSDLDELEKEVIFRSFADEESLVDIAKTLGYSRCHISRVKKRALDRLKANYGHSTEDSDEQMMNETDSSLRVSRKQNLSRVRRRPTRTISARVVRNLVAKCA